MYTLCMSHGPSLCSRLYTQPIHTTIEASKEAFVGLFSQAATSAQRQQLAIASQDASSRNVAGYVWCIRSASLQRERYREREPVLPFHLETGQLTYALDEANGYSGSELCRNTISAVGAYAVLPLTKVQSSFLNRTSEKRTVAKKKTKKNITTQQPILVQLFSSHGQCTVVTTTIGRCIYGS